MARQCLDSGAWDQALALCEALGDANDPGIAVCEAVALYASGDAAAALERSERAARANPTSAAASAIHAEILARTGQRLAAVERLLPLLERYPDYPGAQSLLATLLFPGPHYREVLARLHSELQPKRYLEVGVDLGATLTLARSAELAIGIDPVQQPLKYAISAGTRLFHSESDAFFATHTAQAILGGRGLDLAFIDGMHRFENALSDFSNVERWSEPSGAIVLHDCVPLTSITASRERRSIFWVGDTWKTVLALARYRPELRIRTIRTPPSGLVVIRGLQPASTLLRERFAEIVAMFTALEWSWPPGTMPPEFRPVASDEAGLREALG